MLVDDVAEAMTSDARVVARTVFGTSDPTQIADAILAVCIEHLRSPARVLVFSAVSVGCVFGIELDDGRRIVVKAYQPRWRSEFLRAVVAAQRVLAATGFPCPEPVAGPVHMLGSRALVESFLQDPGQSAVEAKMLATSARGLARQVAACRGLGLDPLRRHPMDSEGDALYPHPHSPIFDFDATTRGAEWIDALARSAKPNATCSAPRQ